MTKEQTQIMQELLVYIDNAIDGKFRAAQAANEKSWFETQLDKIDNGWGAVGEKLGHDNIAGHKVWDGEPVLEVKGAPFDEKLGRDWSQATLEDVPVDWMPEDAVIYWGVDLELKKGTKPLVFGYDADVNLNTHRLFPTAALAQQYLDSQKPVERWKPEMGATYWVVIGTGVPHSTSWIDYKLDREYFEMGNCFRTEQEALAAIDRVKKALRGE